MRWSVLTDPFIVGQGQIIVIFRSVNFWCSINQKALCFMINLLTSSFKNRHSAIGYTYLKTTRFLMDQISIVFVYLFFLFLNISSLYAILKKCAWKKKLRFSIETFRHRFSYQAFTQRRGHSIQMSKFVFGLLATQNGP